MKKFFCLIITVALLTFMTTTAGAVKFEKEKYSIELPEGFIEVEDSRFIGTDNSTLSVSLEENSKDTICVADMSDKDVEKYTNQLAEATESAFGTLGREGSAEILGADIREHINGRKALVITLKTSAKDADKTTILYQRIYEFSCVNNKYVFVYTANTEDDLDAFQQCFDSVIINEAEDKGFVGDIGAYITVAVIFGLFALGIVRFIRTPAKRKAGKIKNKK